LPNEEDISKNMKFIKNDDDLDTSSTGKSDISFQQDIDLDDLEINNDLNSEVIINDVSVV